MIKLFAELDQGTLEDIYELTYKYGWLVAEERQKGGVLNDRAYMEKAKIEQSLRDLIEVGLEELKATYEDWLIFHVKEGWVKELAEAAENMPLADIIPTHWNLPWEDTLEETIIEGLKDTVGGNRGWLTSEEDEQYLAETYGEQFIEYLAENESDNKKAEELLDLTESMSQDELGEYLINEGKMDELIDWIIYDQGWDLGDYLRDIYGTPGEMYDAFPQYLDLEDFFGNLYQHYLDNFPGLEDEIEDIGNTEVKIDSAIASDDVGEKILAFQLGLTTAHHHGTMADHLLAVGPGSGEYILDEISSGPNVVEWNRDLERVLGHPIEAD